MPRSGPGDGVSTNPRDVWYAWRTAMAKRGDPAGDEPLACYEFGVHIGQKMALERTAKWAGLVPLLQDVQQYLIELAVEREARALEELEHV